MEQDLKDAIINMIEQEIDRLKCRSLVVNGPSDHLNILCAIHPRISVSYLVKNIKIASCLLVRRNLQIHRFQWQLRDSCFAVNSKRFDRIFNYIKNQETHHMPIPNKITPENFIELENKYMLRL